MSVFLPKSASIEPQEDMILCRLYASTGKLKKDQKIYIPTMARESISAACIVRIGPGKVVDVDKSGNPVVLPMRFNSGDNVVYSRFKGERVNIAGDLYVLMRQDDVLAKFNIDEEDAKVFLRWATDLDQEDTVPSRM